MITNQNFSGQVINKYPNSDFSKSKICQWHLVTFFSQKMIPIETWYKTHNQKLLAIIEAFKTWRHYLKGCRYKVFVFTDHNNLCQLIDTKSLSSYQIC